MHSCVSGQRRGRVGGLEVDLEPHVPAQRLAFLAEQLELLVDGPVAVDVRDDVLDVDARVGHRGFVAHDGLALEELEPELAAVRLVDVAGVVWGR